MPTRSTEYSAASLARSARSASSSRTRTSSAVGWTNVFSWRNSTVSLPTAKARSPVPTVTSRMGGAAAASRATRVSSVT